jgi:2-haloacid dehalogenase
MAFTKSYSWLLFDADGTLFDYDLAEAKALAGAFTDLGLRFEADTIPTYRKINAQVWLDFEQGKISALALRTLRFERLFQALDMQADSNVFSACYLRNLAQAGDLMPGARELLLDIQRRWRLGLITNGLKDVQRPRLARSGVGDCFEVVVISEEIGVAKPDPLFFEHAFTLAGFPPRETVLVIGDSLSSDIRGGMDYGLDTCWFNPGNIPADPQVPATYVIQQLNQLRALLGV